MRHVTTVMAGAAGALVAVAVMGAAGTTPASNTVRATRFEVVDATGRVRAVLSARVDGPGLVLLDAKGTERVALVTTEAGGPVLFLNSAAGKKQALLAMWKADGPELEMYDAAGQTRAMLMVYKGQPALYLNNAAGKKRAAVAVDDTGSQLELFDDAQHERVTLAVGAQRAGVKVLDANGRIEARLP